MGWQPRALIPLVDGGRDGQVTGNRNPIVDLLSLGSNAGKENEISGVMRHAGHLGYHLCGCGKVLIYSYIFWCHIFNLNS